MLTGSLLALVYAYLVRFMAVSYQSVQSGLIKITPAMDAGADYRPDCDHAGDSAGAGDCQRRSLTRLNCAAVWCRQQSIQ